MKKTNLVTININGVEIKCTQEQAIAIATACGSATQPSKKSQTSAKSAPAKAEKPATREEALTEKYGDKEARTKFVELRKKVAEEFKTLAEEHEVYIPKKKYAEVLKATTVSLNGKMNKKAVKKAFLAAAK